MISCRMATAWIEKKHRTELSWRESLQLSLHLALCDACRQYQVQSSLLEKLFKIKQKDHASCVTPHFEEDAERLERQILRKLDEQKGLSDDK